MKNPDSEIIFSKNLQPRLGAALQTLDNLPLRDLIIKLVEEEILGGCIKLTPVYENEAGIAELKLDALVITSGLEQITICVQKDTYPNSAEELRVFVTRAIQRLEIIRMTYISEGEEDKSVEYALRVRVHEALCQLLDRLNQIVQG